MESALKTSEIDVLEDAPPKADVRSVHAAGVAVEWDEVSHAEWDAHCEGAPYAAYQQAFAYGEALAAIGRPVLRARLFDGAAPIGVAQVQVRKVLGCLTIAHILRGPVWSAAVSDDAKRAAIEAIRKNLPVNGVYAFVVFPEGPDDRLLKDAGYKRIMSGFHTVLVDLTEDEDALRKGLHGKWRNRLKAFDKSATIISPLSKRPERYAWLIEKEMERERTMGRRSHAMTLVHGYQSILGKRAVMGFEAKAAAERVGGMLFLKHGLDATYLIGWASDRGKQVNVHNGLLWRAILALKKAGVRKLDLGGVNTDLNPGIARFKIGAGGSVLSLSGAWTKGPRWK